MKNEEKKQEKVLVTTLPGKQVALEKDLTRAVAFINGQLMTALQDIGFEFTQANIEECVKNSAREICIEYNKRVQQQVSTITIPALRRDLEASSVAGLQKFNQDRQLPPNTSEVFKYITFSEDGATVTPEGKEALVADCGYYLTNPEEIKLFKLHQNAAQALSDLMQGFNTLEWQNWFSLTSAGMKAEPIDYSWLHMKINQSKKEA